MCDNYFKIPFDNYGNNYVIYDNMSNTLLHNFYDTRSSNVFYIVNQQNRNIWNTSYPRTS